MAPVLRRPYPGGLEAPEGVSLGPVRADAGLRACPADVRLLGQPLARTPKGIPRPPVGRAVWVTGVALDKRAPTRVSALDRRRAPAAAVTAGAQVGVYPPAAPPVLVAFHRRRLLADSEVPGVREKHAFAPHRVPPGVSPPDLVGTAAVPLPVAFVAVPRSQIAGADVARRPLPLRVLVGAPNEPRPPADHVRPAACVAAVAKRLAGVADALTRLVRGGLTRTFQLGRHVFVAGLVFSVHPVVQSTSLKVAISAC